MCAWVSTVADPTSITFVIASNPMPFFHSLGSLIEQPVLQPREIKSCNCMRQPVLCFSTHTRNTNFSINTALVESQLLFCPNPTAQYMLKEERELLAKTARIYT